jgi:hypothetical protein
MLINPMDEYLSKYRSFKDLLSYDQNISMEEEESESWVEKLKADIDANEERGFSLQTEIPSEVHVSAF